MAPRPPPGHPGHHPCRPTPHPGHHGHRVRDHPARRARDHPARHRPPRPANHPPPRRGPPPRRRLRGGVPRRFARRSRSGSSSGGSATRPSTAPGTCTCSTPRRSRWSSSTPGGTSCARSGGEGTVPASSTSPWGSRSGRTGASPWAMFRGTARSRSSTATASSSGACGWATTCWRSGIACAPTGGGVTRSSSPGPP